MAEQFVSREEFNILKEEVQSIKKDLDESQKLLVAIDKKIDIISEKVVSNDRIEDLKLQPLDKRVTKLEDNQTWLKRTIISSLITAGIAILGEIIVFVIQLMNK